MTPTIVNYHSFHINNILSFFQFLTDALILTHLFLYVKCSRHQILNYNQSWFQIFTPYHFYKFNNKTHKNGLILTNNMIILL